jgi:Glycosyl hydrolase family 76/Ricin-type beta-trefoil lectin domain-like
MGCLALAVTAAGVLSSPLAESATKAPAVALPSPFTVFNDWNKAFLVQSATGSYGGYGTLGTYYTDELKSKGTERAGTWIAGLDVNVAQDRYERTHSPADWELVKQLVTTELADDGTDWTSWDGWNDDIGWMVNATLRGYQETGNKSWLNVAITQWNNNFNRGWDTVGNGGIWENNTDFSKCALSNDPMIWEGAELYRVTGDGSYLSKAEQIYNWVRQYLYVPATGQVNGCIAYPNGIHNSWVMQGSDNAYDAGGFMEAADALYRATGNKNYYDDGALTAHHFVTTIPIPTNNGERGSAYQYWLFKGMYDLCTDSGTCGKYAAYMYSNAAQAWSERNSLGVTWNDWTDPTNDSNPDAFEMTGMAGLYQDFPATGSSPFNRNYLFRNAATRKLMTVSGDRKTANAPIIQGTNAKDPSAPWRLVRESNGYYEIKNVRSGQLVNVQAASGAPGAKVLQWPAQGIANGNDQWLPIHNANGTWSFYNRNSDLALSVASTATGSELIQAAQSNKPAQQFALLHT